jgi:c-di-GMP-binding flagellar brake protein YcgR
MEQTGTIRQTRISVNIPADYQYRNNKGDCVIVDFSEGGIAIEAKQLFVEGDLINVRATLAKNFQLDIWCVVRNVTGRKIGLQFEEISNQQRNDLQNFVYNLLDSHNKTRVEKY